MKLRLLVFILLMSTACGCATTSQRQSKQDVKAVLNTSEEENIIDAATALGSVSEAITGKEMTEDELRGLAKDLRTNEETQSAVKKIADSLEGKNIVIKYSPATGKRYSADMEYCPETGVKLLPVE